uniref:Uncharacterized protein n=1 Tax=Anguilla anguilla TaxID=7936 RepID=A0A0E9RWF0_ANGAN
MLCFICCIVHQCCSTHTDSLSASSCPLVLQVICPLHFAL